MTKYVVHPVSRPRRTNKLISMRIPKALLRDIDLLARELTKLERKALRDASASVDRTDVLVRLLEVSSAEMFEELKS